jgi:hypothetical protein
LYAKINLEVTALSAQVVACPKNAISTAEKLTPKGDIPGGDVVFLPISFNMKGLSWFFASLARVLSAFWHSFAHAYYDLAQA